MRPKERQDDSHGCTQVHAHTHAVTGTRAHRYTRGPRHTVTQGHTGTCTRSRVHVHRYTRGPRHMVTHGHTRHTRGHGYAHTLTRSHTWPQPYMVTHTRSLMHTPIATHTQSHTYRVTHTKDGPGDQPEDTGTESVARRARHTHRALQEPQKPPEAADPARPAHLSTWGSPPPAPTQGNASLWPAWRPGSDRRGQGCGARSARAAGPTVSAWPSPPAALTAPSPPGFLGKPQRLNLSLSGFVSRDPGQRRSPLSFSSF